MDSILDVFATRQYWFEESREDVFLKLVPHIEGDVGFEPTIILYKRIVLPVIFSKS